MDEKRPAEHDQDDETLLDQVEEALGVEDGDAEQRMQPPDIPG